MTGKDDNFAYQLNYYTKSESDLFCIPENFKPNV